MSHLVFRINNDCFPRHLSTDPCSGEAVCFLGGRNITCTILFNQLRFVISLHRQINLFCKKVPTEWLALVHVPQRHWKPFTSVCSELLCGSPGPLHKSSSRRKLSERGDSLLPEYTSLHLLIHIHVCMQPLFNAAQLEGRLWLRAYLNLTLEISTPERDTNCGYLYSFSRTELAPVPPQGLTVTNVGRCPETEHFNTAWLCQLTKLRRSEQRWNWLTSCTAEFYSNLKI